MFCFAGDVLPLLIRLLAAFVALSVPLAALDGTLYSWHPTFMALGFIGFMAEAVLTSISFRSLEGSVRTAAIQRHMLWQIAAITCVLFGFLAIEANKVSSHCASSTKHAAEMICIEHIATARSATPSLRDL